MSTKITTDTTIYCDLGAAWSKRPERWAHYHPGAWDRMEAAFQGESAPVTICSVPAGRRTYGHIVVGPGTVDAAFVRYWPAVPALVPGELPTADRVDVEQRLGRWFADRKGFLYPGSNHPVAGECRSQVTAERFGDSAAEVAAALTTLASDEASYAAEFRQAWAGTWRSAGEPGASEMCAFGRWVPILMPRALQRVREAAADRHEALHRLAALLRDGPDDAHPLPDAILSLARRSSAPDVRSGVDAWARADARLEAWREVLGLCGAYAPPAENGSANGAPVVRVGAAASA